MSFFLVLNIDDILTSLSGKASDVTKVRELENNYFSSSLIEGTSLFDLENLERVAVRSVIVVDRNIGFTGAMGLNQLKIPLNNDLR